ncbi:uncharacterized protein LTR77_001296 [Saxophila tyrrhenica]|uniref:Piwi-domain-containing protein n=1 Tax=Saxophila tyrrhenica TaxID=1690608 RepID=A0AAV9PMV7_9PEZI|nr:hypothetical protein LTR77_001296 [Saxophila tyrrhenica]
MSGRPRGRAQGGGGGPPGAGQQTQLPQHTVPREVNGIFGGTAPNPDPSVTAAEDALLPTTRDKSFEFTYTVKNKSPAPDELDFTVSMPGRRGYGTEGQEITLRTNYFKFNSDNTILFRYDLSLGSDISRPKRRRLIDEVLRDAMFQGKAVATDYSNVIITTSKLNIGKGWSVGKDMVVPTEPGNTPQNVNQTAVPGFVVAARARNTVKVKLELGTQFTPNDLVQYLSSNAPGAEYLSRDELIQAYNIIMCKRPQETDGIVKAGGNKFYPIAEQQGPDKPRDLGKGLLAYRGYYSSVRPSIGRLLVNINVTAGAFYQPFAVIDLLRASGIPFQQLGLCEAFIRMLKVRAVYKVRGQPDMVKIKTIVGFAPGPGRDRPNRGPRFGDARAVHFDLNTKDANGNTSQTRRISVFDYWKDERGIVIQRPELPVLNVGTPKDPQYMPMEICQVLPGQQYKRMLQGPQTTEMLTFAARKPADNAMSIAGTPGSGLKVFGLAGDTQRQFVNRFGISVGKDMITVPGRILDTPEVRYKNNNSLRPDNGSWNLTKKVFEAGGSFSKWQILVINPQRGEALQAKPDPRSGLNDAQSTLAELPRTVSRYGVRLGQQAPTQYIRLDFLDAPNRASNESKIVQAFKKAQQAGVSMLFVVLPEADKWLYARIKYNGDVGAGIHSVCAVGSKLQTGKGQPMFFANLGLKFCIKGKGVPHKVPNTLSAPLDNNTMLMGIDVTHPSPGSKQGAPSISAVVASTDADLAQWPGSIRLQTGMQEMVQGLATMVIERLRLWLKKNGSLPTKIVLYRDGVSEGQYGLVLRHELPAFHEAFKQLYGAEDKWPAMAIIIVGKRHHTRFYPTKEAEADRRSKNPAPGTIVDRGIAGKILSEFWLQAHHGLQGTARPAHYVVIKDDIKFEADQLQGFTHKLCYLFNRATKAVSICPPAYYADLLCERGRAYLFTTLAENTERAADSSDNSSNAGPAPLTPAAQIALGWSRPGAVHPNLAESTWYI